MAFTFQKNSVRLSTFTDGDPAGGLIVVPYTAYIFGTTWGLDLPGTVYTINLDGAVQAANGFAAILIAGPEGTKNSKVMIGAEGAAYSLPSVGTGYGIEAHQATDVINSGSIEGAIGVYSLASAGHSFAITNNASGFIGGATAIFNGGEAVMILKNAGHISGPVSIFATGAATVTNSGTITGDMFFGSHADKLTNTGTILGTITLGAGDDSFTGGNGSETVHDSGGADTYKLGGGNDIFLAAPTTNGLGTDKVDGGAGIDTYDCSGCFARVLVNLDSKTNQVNSDVMLAKTAEIDNLTDGSDVVTGFEVVIGSNFADTIVGGAAAETFYGGSGADILFAGLGADTLTGGPGADFFDFFTAKDSGVTRATRDTITDFEGAGAGGGDILYLGNIDADTTVGGDQNFIWQGMVNTKIFTGHVRELHAFWQGSQTIVEGDTNGDGKADFSVALNGNLYIEATLGDIVL